MKKLLHQLNEINKKQKELMTEMSKEKCDDIHSVLRAKNFAENIIHLELQINLLKDTIVKQ